MHKGFIKTAVILGALSVALGAFGAHALKQRLSEEELNIFDTGVRYQFYQVFALLATGILYKDIPNKFARRAGMFFIAGIFLFSGSLYFLAYIKSNDEHAYAWIGAITPLGGLSFILGWICLFIGVLKIK